MNFTKIILSIILLILGIGLVVSLTMKKVSNILHVVPQQQSRLRVIGWIPNWDQENAFQSYSQNSTKFTDVSVFWYKLDATGNVTNYQATNEDTTIISFAHSHGQKIFALIANLPDYYEGKDWDWERVQKVISSEDVRQKHIADLVNLVTTKGFDGLDIDYEALHGSQKNDFSLFITELGEALHKKNKLLGIAIYPPSAESINGAYGPSAQDIPILAKAADQLYVMTYLEHTLSSPPGPTGGLPWIKNSMDYATHTLQIPKEKLFMGIGLMGVAWRQDPDGSIVGDKDDISFSQVLSLVQSHNVSPSWDDTSKSPYVEFSDEYGKHIVWFENAESVKDKITLAKQLGVGGIALWRLGGEDSAIWQNL